MMLKWGSTQAVALTTCVYTQENAALSFAGELMFDVALLQVGVSRAAKRYDLGRLGRRGHFSESSIASMAVESAWRAVADVDGVYRRFSPEVAGHFGLQ